MNSSSIPFFYSPKNIVAAAAVTISYLLLSYLLVGFKTDQLFLAALFNVLYFTSSSTRKFILGFSIFIVYWIIFDYMKAFPNYKFNTVHIEDLYSAEKSLFGMAAANGTVTPNEFWIAHQNNFLDVLCGIFYLCWIPVPLAFAAWLFFKNKSLFLQFSLTFVLVNFLGFVIYYTYPAAPPWYIQQNGNGFIAGTPGNTAGLIRFDDFFGINIFKNLYAKGSNVFAAMPSLHSSYPLIVFYYGLKKRVGLAMSIIFVTVMVGIWFAAVYTSHHYVLDVLAGIICAIAGIILFQTVLMRSKAFSNLLGKYQQLIS
ncbi:MAG: phosphatase PAP2 family protein [Bacteroidota bacterium]